MYVYSDRSNQTWNKDHRLVDNVFLNHGRNVSYIDIYCCTYTFNDALLSPIGKCFV